MKFSYASVLAALALLGLPASSIGAGRTSTGIIADDNDVSKPEIPPHIGCEFMLRDKEGPHPKLVGEDFEMITTTDYKVENEAGTTAAKCVDGNAGGYGCNNVDLLSMIENQDLTGQIGGGYQEANDIWGWADDGSGREFAIIGMKKGTVFVEITDVNNPVVIGGLPTQGNGSSWRDIKTMGHYALIVSEEGGHGMQVFNLNQLLTASPGTIFTNTAHLSSFGSAHNVFVNEETKVAYVVGATTCSGGLYMVDLSNPEIPNFAGCFSDDGYTHDVQCVVYNGPDSNYKGKEICFASNEDTITIVDMTPESPVQISRIGYESSYTHQGWLTEDHKYFIFNDELDERGKSIKTSTHVMDVRDLNNPIYKGAHVGRTRAIDHNNYIIGDYVYQANYRAGLNILKINNPRSIDFEEAGYFDIYPDSDSANFNGAWSNYPFFPSGTIVVSGIEQGLFVLDFTGNGSPPTPPPNQPPNAPPTERPNTPPPNQPPNAPPTERPNTPPPNQPPNAPPTERPTELPGDCEGSDAKALFSHNRKKRKCSWKRTPCGIDHVRKFCPDTCSACQYQCQDYDRIFYIRKKVNAKKWTCKELADLNDRQKRKKCNKKLFKTTCRATCNFCN